MKIRLLPMSKLEFKTTEDVLDFLMKQLPERGGKYYFRRRSILYKEDIIVAFQYNGMIVASAILVGQSMNGKIENGVEYKGYYIFDTQSFIQCKDPVKVDEIKQIMPEFKNFNQSTQFLSDACIKLIR